MRFLTAHALLPGHSRQPGFCPLLATTPCLPDLNAAEGGEEEAGRTGEATKNLPGFAWPASHTAVGDAAWWTRARSGAQPSPVPHHGPHRPRRRGESTALRLCWRRGGAAPPGPSVGPLLLPILPERLHGRQGELGAPGLQRAALADHPVAPDCAQGIEGKLSQTE